MTRRQFRRGHDKGKRTKSQTTNKQFLHGDFDRDGVPNVDDAYPFSKRKNKRVNPEVSMSKLLLSVEQKREKAMKVAKKLKKEHDMDAYRVKDTYSVLDKLARKHLGSLGDFIGLRKEYKGKRQGARKLWKKYNEKMKLKTKARRKCETPEPPAENKYKTLSRSDNPYRAYHSNSNFKGYGVEAQFRTKTFGKFNDSMHERYKKGKVSKEEAKKLLSKSKRLVKRGY
jgi:hypothetical protein